MHGHEKSTVAPFNHHESPGSRACSSKSDSSPFYRAFLAGSVIWYEQKQSMRKNSHEESPRRQGAITWREMYKRRESTNHAISNVTPPKLGGYYSAVDPNWDPLGGQREMN
ncbi:hypothetical protein OROGR_010636 [Orobanche gracilis]